MPGKIKTLYPITLNPSKTLIVSKEEKYEKIGNVYAQSGDDFRTHLV
jgi:hypothetical protein